jgi:hypothetical protein
VVDAMTDHERAVLERWIIEHVDDTVVPADEGHGQALAYNLIQRLRHGRAARLYNYEPDQDAEIMSWYGGSR